MQAIVLLILSGCINIRTEYPTINYYRLNQEPLNISNLEKVSGALLIRHFSSSIDLETERLLAVWNDNRLQRYYYHRWNADCSALVTDYILERYNKLDAFTNGVVKESSFIIPDYILEGQIVEFLAYNHRNNLPDSNYVVVTVHASLLKKEEMIIENRLILNKTYTETVSRARNNVETIPPAFSKAVAIISDRLLTDISETINQK